MLQYFNVHEYRGGRGGAEIHDNAGGQLAGAGRPVHVAGPDQTELVTENEHFDDLQFARCSSEHGAGRSRGGTAVLPYWRIVSTGFVKNICRPPGNKGPITPLPVSMRTGGGGGGASVETPDTWDDSSSVVTSAARCRPAPVSPDTR